MFRVEKICSDISEFIGKELDFEKEKVAVINYGIFAFVQILTSVILVSVLGYMFDVLVEGLIILSSICILRQSSGGVHASSPEFCTFVSTVLSIGAGVIIKNCNMDILVIIMIGIPIFAWAYYTIYKLAPVDSPAKPIKKVEKRKRLKKSSIKIITVYFLVVILNIVGYLVTKKVSLLMYSGCIYIGLLWQVFSLTKTGHVILGKLDALFK